MTAYATVDDLRLYLEQVAGLTAQTITISGATGGTFTLVYGTATTPIASSASAATVQAALEALPAIGAKKAQVSGPAGGPWDVTLSADMARSAMPLTVGTNSLTGTSPAIAIEQTHDAILQKVLNHGRSILDEALRLSFFDAGAAWPSASARTVRSERSQWLRLPPYKQGSITQIVLYGETSAVEEWDEEWEAGRYYLYRHDGWLDARYTATAQWGLGPAPDALVQLNLELATNIWRGRKDGMFQNGVGANGGGYLKFIGGLTPQQQAIITAIHRTYTDVAY
ncbi:MAG TPA: hypothetical protein VFS21_33330 [Roseiflexaceae bacterium]|nr:hypothetical protein [Roseiflexaceae bacterium]